MHCLITGAGGYVGTYLTNELKEQGIFCLTPSHREFDLTDLTGMERYMSGKDIDRVIHLAGAVNIQEEAALYEANIVGLYRLLYVCGSCGVRHFTFASSNVVYSLEETSAHSTEDTCSPDPDNLYAVSKYAGELLVSDYCAAHGMKWANVRIADIYGPGQKYGNLVLAAVNSAAAGETLKLYGMGVRRRDYIYITDVARGLSFISTHEMSGNINLGTGIGTSVAELVSLAAELSIKLHRKDCKIQQVTTKNEDISQIWLDVKPLKAAGFIAETTLREGLKKCIEEKMRK